MRQDHLTLTQLRSEGFAVVVFNPEELRGVDPERVQARLVEVGNEVIDVLAPQAETDPTLAVYEVICRSHCAESSLWVVAPGRRGVDEVVRGTRATWVVMGYEGVDPDDIDFTLPGDRDKLRDFITNFEEPKP